MTDSFVTLAAFAERLKTSPRNAKQVWERSGLPTYQIGGRARLRESDVCAFLEGQKIESAAPKMNLKNLVHAAIERARKRRSV